MSGKAEASMAGPARRVRHVFVNIVEKSEKGWRDAGDRSVLGAAGFFYISFESR
jgi:hypothetical protein